MAAGPSRETLFFGDVENIVSLSHLSEEEQNAAKESFFAYTRPVDVYKVLQYRANQHPSFLTRCLHYKIKDQHKRRPRTTVIYNHIFYNNTLHKTEVTEDYACPFCSLKCASYEGLKWHLPASHDLYNYEFGGERGHLVVNVTSKITDTSTKIVGNVNREEKVFSFRSIRRRKNSQRQNQNHAGPLLLDSSMPGFSARMDCELYSSTGAGVSSVVADIMHSEPQSATPSLPGRQAPLLQTQRVFHSHAAQKHGDLVDVTQHENQMMDLWNSLIGNHRGAADALIPWACETLSTQHGRDIVLNPQLLRCWRLFMVKLRTIGRLDAITMDKCLSILNNYGDQYPEN